MSVYPKISIVTPSFNQGQFLEETIRSVLDQNYPNLEYIVIDGGSSDNSVEIIKKYQDQLSYWVSEKDQGQAHAIHKGLQHCSGEVFNWLNSDDYLEPGALVKIGAEFRDQEVQLLAGNVRVFSNSEEEIISNQNLSATGLMTWAQGVIFVQPGVWMRRNLLEKCGGIDQKYHYAFDWDLYIRYLYHFPKVKEISDILVHFRLHINSKTESMREHFEQEERKVIEKISKLEEFSGLKSKCEYKIQKAAWTKFLSELSIEPVSFQKKLQKLIGSMLRFSKVSFSRQTVGAMKAFWFERNI